MSHYFPRALRQPVPDTRSIVVVSDIEMGEPGRYDDFPHDAFLAELFAAYTQPPYDGVAVDLVLNGDIFDLLKVSHYGEYPRHITAEVAIDKLEVVLQSHPGFIEGLRFFGTHASGNKRIHFISGNHDPELLFQPVAQVLSDHLEGVAEVAFHSLEARLGPVLLEHGHQHDDMFRFDPEHLFGHYRGERILNLPWGNVSLLEVTVPLHKQFYHFERLVPRHILLERMPKLNELLLQAFRRYYSRDYIVRTLREWDDPTRRISWDMVKTLVARFDSGNTNVSIEDKATLNRMFDDPYIEAICQGHLHTPTWMMHGGKVLMRTGCMRDEYLIHRFNDILKPVPKSYGELVLQNEHVVLSRLFHVQGPQRSKDTLPEDVFTFTPDMQDILDNLNRGG